MRPYADSARFVPNIIYFTCRVEEVLKTHMNHRPEVLEAHVDYARIAGAYLLPASTPKITHPSPITQLSIVVSSIYWSLVTLAPNLILRSDPGSTEPSSTGPSLIRIPLSLDLALHASPVISLLIDLFAFEAPYSKWETKYSAPAVASVFGVWYAFWVERCAGINKSCECGFCSLYPADEVYLTDRLTLAGPYPFLENPFPIRVAIYAAVCTVAVLSFQGVAGLHRSLYGGRPSETTKGKTKKQA